MAGHEEGAFQRHHHLDDDDDITMDDKAAWDAAADGSDDDDDDATAEQPSQDDDDNVINMSDFDDILSLKKQIANNEEALAGFEASPKDTDSWRRDVRSTRDRIERLKRTLATKLRQRDAATGKGARAKSDVELAAEYELTQLVMQHDINRIIKEKAFTYDGQVMDDAEIINYIPALLDKKTKILFLQILLGDPDNGVRRRHYERTTYRLNPPPNHYGLSKSDHLLRGEGETAHLPHHEFYDYLMESLSSGRRAEAEHIEKCFLQKLLVPSTRLPALCLYGDGSAGKGVFSLILKTVAGENAVITSPAKFTGRFAPSIEGALFLAVDEGDSEKTSNSALKRLIGNDLVEVETKFGPIRQVYVDYWAVLATNKLSGPVRLSTNRHGEDRRWSWIRCYMELPSVVARRRNCSVEEAEMWLADLRKRGTITQPAEIDRWIHHLRQKYPNIAEETILPFHGEDYELAVTAQSTPLARLAAATLARADTPFIKTDTLYRMYQALSRVEGYTINYKRRAFDLEFANHLRKNYSVIVTKQTCHYKRGATAIGQAGQPTTGSFWVLEGYQGPFHDNSADFITEPDSDRKYDFGNLVDPDRFD